MSVELSAEIRHRLAQDSVGVAVLVHIQTDPVIAVWSGLGTVDWVVDGEATAFLGVGDLGEISPISTSSNGEALGMTLALNGFNPAMMSEVLRTEFVNRLCRIWLAVLSDNGGLGEPVLVAAAHTDAVSIEGMSRVVVPIENHLAQWDGAPGDVWSDADQQAKYPGDRGLELIGIDINKQLTWGPQQ